MRDFNGNVFQSMAAIKTAKEVMKIEREIFESSYRSCSFHTHLRTKLHFP